MKETVIMNEIKDYFADLKAVFYAAGTVQQFARPFLSSGVRVFSAWAANGIPVAEFTAAQIILANKGYFRLDHLYKTGGFDKAMEFASHFGGNYNAKVGLLGAGVIGKYVIQLLKPYELDIYVFDPFLSEAQAKELGVVKTSMEEIFTECDIISNHLANNAQTKGMLRYGLFSGMKDYATFINTGRGAQIDGDALIRAMAENPTRTALLDVTDPEEPLPPDSPYLALENVFISPHRAGSVNSEIRRMGRFMFDEYEKVLSDKPALYEVTMEMLDTLA
jgi:phosphoglycerate dehydrogenase-like enzyme